MGSVALSKARPRPVGNGSAVMPASKKERIGMRYGHQRYLTVGMCLLATLQLAACSSVNTVAPYDRGYLAEDGMQWEQSSRNAKLQGHVYTSKEASSGGAGAAGGGCGCN